MLTAELVRIKRPRGGAGAVTVVPNSGVDDKRAAELAEAVIDTVTEHQGRKLGELLAALKDLESLADDAHELRLLRALSKLAVDACDFDVASPVEPEALRAEVFAAAAQARAAKPPAFDRAAVLRAVAQAHDTSVDVVEEALFGDLKDAHAVDTSALPSAAQLLAQMPVAEVQALLLRAQRLELEVEASALELRALLRAVKLHQLVFDAELTDDGVRLVVDGPMAMFQQSARYGLKLALLVPHVLATRRFALRALVRLKKAGAAEPVAISGARRASVDVAEAPEQVRTLLADLAAAGGPWRASLAVDVLKLPGEGAFVPDLVLEHAETGERVFVEVLGFWSRAAVWRRVELVERGLPYRAVFCVSERLRVSEEALPQDAPSSLYVYKGVIRAAKLLEHVARAAAAR